MSGQCNYGRRNCLLFREVEIPARDRSACQSSNGDRLVHETVRDLNISWQDVTSCVFICILW